MLGRLLAQKRNVTCVKGINNLNSIMSCVLANDSSPLLGSFCNMFPHVTRLHPCMATQQPMSTNVSSNCRPPEQRQSTVNRASRRMHLRQLVSCFHRILYSRWVLLVFRQSNITLQRNRRHVDPGVPAGQCVEPPTHSHRYSASPKQPCAPD